MKKTISFSCVICILFAALSACSKDEPNEGKKEYRAEQFQGEWCAINDDGTATYLNIATVGFTGLVLQNLDTAPTLYETLSGMWAFRAQNSVIQLSTLHSSTGNELTEAYDVVSLSNLTMQLRSQEYGYTDTYSRVVDSKTLYVGEQAVISLNGLGHITGYSTTCTRIVSVDSDGRLTANGPGKAFIMVYTAEDTVLVQIDVQNRVKIFENELSLTVDEVKALHGTPDNDVQYNQNMAMVYRQSLWDKALSAVQYQYDAQTKEVTRILTLYAEAAEFSQDCSFIVSNYFLVLENTYGMKPEYIQNDILLSTITDAEGFNYVSYNNFGYYYRKGHY